MHSKGVRELDFSVWDTTFETVENGELKFENSRRKKTRDWQDSTCPRKYKTWLHIKTVMIKRCNYNKSIDILSNQSSFAQNCNLCPFHIRASYCSASYKWEILEVLLLFHFSGQSMICPSACTHPLRCPRMNQFSDNMCESIACCAFFAHSFCLFGFGGANGHCAVIGMNEWSAVDCAVICLQKHRIVSIEYLWWWWRGIE